MSTVLMDKREEIVMRLVHYFITVENYTPIVVNGVKNEIWLENIDGPYRIIRINSNYIHNKEQYDFDIYKLKNIVHQIKKKTMSLKMNTLNIFLNLNDDVKVNEEKNINCIKLHDIKELEKNSIIVDAFPNISNNLLEDTNGIDLIVNVTNDINEKTAKENKKYESVFSSKKILITYLLIAINIIIFIISVINPNLWINYANNATLVRNGEYYRLFTSMFFHVDILHLLCNMYSLYVLGTQVEQYMGKSKFIFIYFISGIVGNLLSITFNNIYSIGASGAIFGLLGALIYFGYHYRLYLNSVVKTEIIPITIINLLYGFVNPGIDNLAHIGGLIGGYLSTMGVGVPNKSKKSDMINGFIVLTLLIIFLVYFSIIK